VSLLFLSLSFLKLFRSWCLNFKYKHSVWVRLYISHDVIDVINNLSEYRMSGIIYICNVNNSRLEYSHSSLVDSIHNLDSSIDFTEVEDVVPMDLES
jgi:hypothetical protein